jgi:pentatricopeptide repeat protein
LLYAIGGNGSGLGSASDLPDSLIDIDHVYEYTYSDFDKAKIIMEELRKRGEDSEYDLDRTEGDLYYNSGHYYTAIKYYGRMMRQDSLSNDPQAYMESIHRMISCYDCLHDEENGSKYINLLFKVSDKEGSRVMESIAMFCIGKMLYHQGDKERAFYHLNEAVKMMEESDYKYKFDNLTYEYNMLLVLLMREGNYEEALKVLDKLQLLTSGGDEGDVVKMENLSDKEKKTYYAQRAVLLFKLGRKKEADEAYASWRSIGDKYAKDDYLIVPYLMDKKEYATVISIYKKQEAFLKAHSDTITYHMKMVQHILGDAYNAIGDYEKASQYYKQLSVLVDSLKMREQKSTALEMAEFYDKSERELQLQEEKNRVRTRTQMFLSVSVVAVVLLVLFIYSIMNARRTKRKNLAMVRTIYELISYKDDFEKARARLLMMSGDSAKEISEGEDEGSGPDDQTDFSDSYEGRNKEDEAGVADMKAKLQDGTIDSEELAEDRSIFEILDSKITKEKLYLNPSLSREDLVRFSGLNRNRLAKVINRNTGLSTIGYINKKRLEYAVEILMKHPKYKIAAVAEMCGIPNVPTFNRLFRTKFGMTPSEYKRVR